MSARNTVGRSTVLTTSPSSEYTWTCPLLTGGVSRFFSSLAAFGAFDVLAAFSVFGPRRRRFGAGSTSADPAAAFLSLGSATDITLRASIRGRFTWGPDVSSVLRVLVTQESRAPSGVVPLPSFPFRDGRDIHHRAFPAEFGDRYLLPQEPTRVLDPVCNRSAADAILHQVRLLFRDAG